jgi:hypothetical protein
MIAPACYLLDGPLLSAADRRDVVKARMVRDLVDAGSADLTSARRLLYARDFFALDIELLATEALYEARAFRNQLAAVDGAMQEP